MNTIDNKSVQTKTFRWKRWQRWAVGTGCALAAYSAAGFWLVPYVIKNQLPKFAEKELARQASIDDVRFNPFTLRLDADKIAFREAASADGKTGAPLLSIGALAVQLEWKSIVRRAWSLAEIRITAPQTHLTITPDGKFNLAEVLATWQRNHPEKSDGGMPRLVIAHFALEQGKVDWQDQKAGYADNFTPINFTLDNISTLPDANGSYSLSADAARGGKLHWRGTASLSPIRGEGELILNDASLPGLAAYLKAYTRARVTSGKLSARLPYAFSYTDGKLEATVKGAGLALRDLALVRDGKGEAFTSLNTLGIAGVNADLAHQSVTVDKINLYGGKVAVRRDARGEIDVANLMLPGNPAPAASATTAPSKPGKWKVDLKQLALANVDVSAIDETVSPALQLSARQLQLNLQLALQQGQAGNSIIVDGASFGLADLTMQRGAQTPFKLDQLGFTEGKIDLAAHTVHLGALTASGAQIDLARNRQGEFAIAQKLPVFASGKADAGKDAPSAPWSTKVDKVELSKFGARFDDAGTGIKGNLQDARLSLHNVSNDMKQALPFELGVGLREGGLLTANGKFVPGTGAVDAQLNLKQLTLAPVQPLLAQHVKLKLAGGSLSGSGRLTTGGGAPKTPKVRYEGGVDIAGLVLNETDGKRFASWKSVRADKLTASVGPDFVDIPELRVVEPNAQLIIENDRSLNAQRLLVKAPEPATAPSAAAPVATATPAADAAFPVRVRRVRLQNAKLDFADLSLRPQFAAKIYELNGVVTGLSTKRDARSQIELDGRIDEFGLARVRGQLNPFAPTDNTDLNVVFKNVDMVSASPYTMKFAGYKVAEGKISLDLQYKVRNRQLDGTNQIVLDKLTLGERIDSPDALKLPLELALAILKDSDGRIDLGLPVSGDMNDPQFSYGALIWKAVGNVLTKIVTAPFRALGNLLGISADKLEAIDFDAGSAVLLPPEREKLKQVAQILAKREQLKLAVPGQYSDTDAAALRAQAVRRAVAAKAGIKLEAGEEPGPLNLGERKIRGALRDLYGERFGKAELDKQKKAAESAAPATAAASSAASAPAAAKIPVFQRLGKLIEGEPQVADTGAFYTGLREQLEAKQPLPADALSKLGAQRSAAILAALQQDGTPAARVSAGAPEKTEAAPGKLVGLKLGLAAQ
ncbi:DUF748 domain-containing protein [Janthinobacterium sp. 75]|uniref:DUF748 domain-containing protein n=1 Tax=Janthinobacterium sp. 75 TaxID=2135628 RepID=UPI0010F26D3A|nr:DUF748 domain-containing protein [Janthinobacterium sp. 75]TDY35934.1 uncharacterized protein DUF748 [Janthinobacterium sp. 75]